jgi:hypothetical protein
MLPLRYARLSPQEMQRVIEGKGSLLLAETSGLPPVEGQTFAAASRPTEQEALVFQYLQLLDAKLNWIIERLGDEKLNLAAQGETIELGAGGLRFATTEPPPVGALLRMQLQLPLTAAPSVHFLAEVLRVEPERGEEQQGDRAAVAVRFTEIEESERERIIQFIFERERQELRRRRQPDGQGV